MKVREWKIIFVLTIIVAVVFLAPALWKGKKPSKDNNLIFQTMKITSPSFSSEAIIPSRYTCDGKDINPSLNISEVPPEAKSLVLIVDDPDAPGDVWTHWTLWNILPDISTIEENSVPDRAVQGVTSFGNSGWGGPCPPQGIHRYYFKLYALDIWLNPDSTQAKDALEKAMEDHILDKAELIGIYGRE